MRSVDPCDIKPFGVPQLELMLAGNREKVRHHLNRYVELTSILLEELARAIQQMDAEEVRRLAHKGKGAAGMIGANAFVAAAAQLEAEAAHGQLRHAEALLGTLIQEVQRARHYASAY